MAHGRGAWPVSGAGGTKKYKDASKPGPYYYLGSGKTKLNDDEFAVRRAIRAYQRALNRRLGTDLRIDGRFGEHTAAAVWEFQEKNSEKTGTPWGGIGPETSEALLRPDAEKVIADRKTKVTLEMVTGTVRHEGIWDAGAVGYLDPNDLGLAQINGPAHPDMTKKQRLNPIFSFNFIVDYYENALKQLDGNLRDAVASYNLGIGGTRAWIKAGRPDLWTPAGASRPRNVKLYIDNILKG